MDKFILPLEVKISEDYPVGFERLRELLETVNNRFKLMSDKSMMLKCEKDLEAMFGNLVDPKKKTNRAMIIKSQGKVKTAGTEQKSSSSPVAATNIISKPVVQSISSKESDTRLKGRRAQIAGSTEAAVTVYLKRQPRTMKQLVKKFGWMGLQKNELENIIKQINPQKYKIVGCTYLSVS